MQTLVSSRRASTIAHVYPSVLQAIVGGAMRNVWRGDFMGYWGVVMQDLGYELPRISILGTSVNRGMKWKGQSLRTLALLLASSSTTVFAAVPHPIVLGAENSEVLPSESVAVAVM